MKTNFTEQDLQFYPTPKSLLDRITDSLKYCPVIHQTVQISMKY